MRNKIIRNSLIPKIAITAICIIVFVILYTFGGLFFEETNEQSENVRERKDSQDLFVFTPEELTYDGTGELDLLEGVSLEGYSAQDLKKIVFTRISTGDNLSEKIIEYSADTDKGRIKSTRTLKLENYQGPVIVLVKDIPFVKKADIENLAETLSSQRVYEADDGFGNDARDHVEVLVESYPNNSAAIQCSFTLENMFGDRAYIKVDSILTDVPAIISLTESNVLLRVGDSFDPSAYIDQAEDQYGNSIVEEVVYGGEVDTMQPGEYFITYDLRGEVASLDVIVTE